MSSEGLEVYADVPCLILGLHHTGDHGLVGWIVAAHRLLQQTAHLKDLLTVQLGLEGRGGGGGVI